MFMTCSVATRYKNHSQQRQKEAYNDESMGNAIYGMISNFHDIFRMF